MLVSQLWNGWAGSHSVVMQVLARPWLGESLLPCPLRWLSAGLNSLLAVGQRPCWSYGPLQRAVDNVAADFTVWVSQGTIEKWAWQTKMSFTTSSWTWPPFFFGVLYLLYSSDRCKMLGPANPQKRRQTQLRTRRLWGSLLESCLLHCYYDCSIVTTKSSSLGDLILFSLLILRMKDLRSQERKNLKEWRMLSWMPEPWARALPTRWSNLWKPVCIRPLRHSQEEIWIQEELPTRGWTMGQKLLGGWDKWRCLSSNLQCRPPSSKEIKCIHF